MATNNYNKRINPMRLTRLACAVAFGLACHSAFAATAYVSNEKDDSISAIDLDSLEVTATLDVGMRRAGCCCLPTTNSCTSAPATPTACR